MAKETMLTYLDEQLTKRLPDYDVAIDWDVKNHTVELVIRLFAENPTKLHLDDAQGVASEEEVIEFEDGVLLVDPKKSNYEATDYLAVYPYEGKKGLRQAELDSFVTYLQEVMDEGLSNLLDFLNDDTDQEEAVFELKWDRERFAAIVRENEAKGQTAYLPYPAY